MADVGSIIGISAGGSASAITMDLAQLEATAVATLIELRILNKNVVATASGSIVSDDPNVDRLDALANGLYANPPVLPTAGQ